MNRQIRFNLYLTIALVLCGCQSPQSKTEQQLSTIRVHLEATRDTPDRTDTINIIRSQPIELKIEKRAFVDEASIAGAELIENVGGYYIRVEFDRGGGMLLEQYSSANVGRRLAIFSQFVCPTNAELNEARWIAAPKITQRIGDKSLTFTPDASREEAEQIVLGLQNIARKREEASKSIWR